MHIFLGIIRQNNIVIRCLRLYSPTKLQGCNTYVRMSLKVHFLYSYLDFFPEYLRAVSDKHGA